MTIEELIKRIVWSVENRNIFGEGQLKKSIKKEIDTYVKEVIRDDEELPEMTQVIQIPWRVGIDEVLKRNKFRAELRKRAGL